MARRPPETLIVYEGPEENMTKIRVHELAKELGMANKDMELRLKELGYRIKNYMSTLEDNEVQEIRLKILEEKEGEAAAAKKEPSPIIRRKHAVFRIKKLVPVKEQEVEAQPSLSAQEPGAVEEKLLSAPAPGETVAPVAAEETVEALAPPEPEDKKARALEGLKEKPAAPEAVTSARPETKSFVKILNRPRVVIPGPAPSQGRKFQKPVQGQVGQRGARGGQFAEKPGRMQKPAPTAEILPLPVPEKKGKKKLKRVVQLSEMQEQAKRHKAAPKRQDKPKPISRLLVEELDAVETPAQTESDIVLPVPKPTMPPKKKAPKVAEAPSVGTAPPKAGKRKLVIYETIQVGELAKRMGVKIGDVVAKLIGMGVMATANQAIDYDTAAIVAAEFDYEIEKKAVAEDMVNIDEAGGGEPQLRPPVVTVMGHVDHGKTSLLDAIRHADVASREAGGITQHIGAYHVTLPSGSEVVFLDTPGHEAFTAMRARGAKVTDIVILVVAADDGVMAQTREAIDHAKAAGVPIIVAINKIDKPGANPDRVKAELAELGLVPEDWGGDTIFVNISAKQKIGIEELLEMLALQSEVLELKADPKRPARGHVVEAKLDKGRGPVSTLLISEGTLHVGDAIVCSLYYGKVRAMINDKGGQIDSAGPSMPVEIQGLSGVPEAGNDFIVLPDEKKAREVAEYRQRKAREVELAKVRKISLESVFDKFKEQELKELNLILKADVQGSFEAISDALRKLSTQEIKINMVGGGIGAVTESDVLLATASNAIIIGFNVRPGTQAKALAEQEKVDIRFYDVIYNAIEEVRNAMTGLLEPVYEEKTMGRAEVREIFHVPKIGAIAGCYVLEGMVQRNAKVRLLRDNVVVYTGKIASLRRFKEDAKEVQAGYECGIGLDKFNDIKMGDIIEAYRMEEKAAVLGEALVNIDTGEGPSK